MPEYRLMYFNSKGFAEISRLLFAEAGVEYEDVRFDSDSWPKQKPNTPFKQMPVLEVDGVQIADSCAVARFLGKQFGMAGKGAVEEALVDMYAAAAYDLVKPIPAMMNADDEKKKEIVTKWIEDNVPKFMDKFESTLAASESGFLVGNSVTWADFTLFHFMSFIPAMMPPELYAKYPSIKKHYDMIGALPRIAKWVNERPVTKT